MMQLVLIMILAPFGASEIIVDEDGFVTLIESPEVRAKEAIFAETVRAYNNYRNTGEGDLEALILQHEALLESDRELVPKARQMIGNQLAELRREQALASVAITPESYSEIKEEPEYLKYKEIELQYKEELIENLPEEDVIEAARQFHELALKAANSLDVKSRRYCVRYLGRSRQKALEAAQKDGLEDWKQREALGLVESTGSWLLGELKHLKDAALCREFIAAYPDDKELVEKIEKLLDELASD